MKLDWTSVCHNNAVDFILLKLIFYWNFETRAHSQCTAYWELHLSRWKLKSDSLTGLSNSAYEWGNQWSCYMSLLIRRERERRTIHLSRDNLCLEDIPVDTMHHLNQSSSRLWPWLLLQIAVYCYMYDFYYSYLPVMI